MATFVMLTRLSPDALTEPGKVNELNEAVEERIKRQCPQVSWVSNYAVLGPYDCLDIFEAPDNETATRVALIVRSFGHATTETWVASEWDRFKDMASEIGG
jgi:uncharacterized protein with GYD domain